MSVFVWNYVLCDVSDVIQLSRHFVLKGCCMMLFLLDN